MSTRKSLKNTFLIIAFGSMLVFSFNNIVSAQIGRFVTIELNGTPVRIHYYNNPPAQPSEPYATVIFFHGMPVSGAVWPPVMLTLGNLANVDSYALSFVGYGKSEAPSPDFFDYKETTLNQVPFKFADAMGIERFIPVVHDLGGPWTICPATNHIERLDGLVAMNTPPPSSPDFPIPPMIIIQILGEFMGNPDVPSIIIKKFLTNIMEGGTVCDLVDKFPLTVTQIIINNSQPDNRLAISKIIEEAKNNPVGFGGICYDEYRNLDVLEPLLVWGMDDPVEGPNILEVFQEAWPSAQTVEVWDASHWVMLDQEFIVSQAIADYINERLGSIKGSKAPTIWPIGKLPAVWADIKSNP